MGKMPKSVTCYICGRGYGTKSISIHIPNCEKKWVQEQELRPKKERRPVPKAPSNWDAIINQKDITHKDLEKLNNQAFEEYNEFSLERCQFCQRTFNSESFKKHQRICTAEKPMKPVSKNVAQVKEDQKDLKNTPSQTKFTKQKKPEVAQEAKKMPQNTKIFKPFEEKKDFNNTPLTQSKNNAFTDEGETENVPLQECYKCGRHFASDRLGKHENICKGNEGPKKVQKFH